MTSKDLAGSIHEHHAEHAPPFFVQAQGTSGEIAVVETPDGSARRVVLVATSDEVGICTVLLASNMLDQATDIDVLVRSEESGAPYDLMLQAELYGPVFREQLDRLVGQCAPDATSAITLALRTDGESLAGRETGTPLGGLDDPRRRFKEEELGELLPIVSTCRRWLMGDLAEVVSILPEMLFPPPPDALVDDVLDQLERVYDIIAKLESTGRRLPWELLALMDDAARTELRRWRIEYGVRDIWTRLEQLCEYEADSVLDLRASEPQRANALLSTPKDELTDALCWVYVDRGTSTLDFVSAGPPLTGGVHVVSSPDGSHILRTRERALEEVA